MGFMDKAKQMAEQAQKKLDDVQQDFNQKQGQGQQQQGAPAVQYDKHGRPIQPGEPEAPVSAPAAPPPEAAPASGEETAPAAPAAAAPPPQEEAAAPPPAPAPPPATGEKDDSGDEGEPPKMTSGDPLAG
jgi:hypothetical protein